MGTKFLTKFLKLSTLILFIAVITGCATQQQTPYDYTAFKQSKPRSVLILPPKNETPDVNATYGMLSQMTMPLAEAGYYVFPVTLVDETFKQNGLVSAHDIHAVAPNKLREIFGADAALYVTVTQYGATYTVIDSTAVVTAKAKLIDLKTGTILWQGAASANNQDNGGNDAGLAGILVKAVVRQILNSVTDATYSVAGQASQQLLSAGDANSILYGPYSEKFGTD